MAKFSHYVDLTAGERGFLKDIQEEHREFRRRETVLDRGEVVNDIHAVKSGWVYGYSNNRDGSAFVAELYLPGDFLGASQIGFLHSTLTYVAATDVVTCPFPKRALEGMLRAHPRLVALIFSLASLDHASIIDRMRALGRMSARDSLAMFLLQVRSRLSVLAGRMNEAVFDLPLSQELIGNIVGLSMVSVNRAFRQLEDEGHIRRDNRKIRILNPDRLGEEIDFDDRHQAVDKSWFPQSADG